MMFHFDEGCMSLPDGWKDQTINIISSTGGAQAGLTFTITREEMPWGMQFDEYVDVELGKAGKALNDFTIVDRKPVQISGNPAHQVECTWKAKQGLMHQIITTINQRNKAIVVTASSPEKMSDSQKKQLVDTVNTFRFLDRTGV